LIPNLLTRYVIWELTKIFLISSAGFVVLMVIVGLAEEAADNGLGPEIVLRLTPYILPKALMFAMPATCLFSVCVVFGRLAAENELVAIESMGVKKSVLVFPALLIAFVISLFSVWLNDIAFAWSYWGVEHVILESSDDIIYGLLQQEGHVSTEQFSIEVDGVEDRLLIHPVIIIKNARRGDTRIVAKEAYLASNPQRHSLNFTVTSGFIEFPDHTMIFDDSITHEIPLKNSDEIARSSGNPSHLYLSQIRRAIDAQESDLAELHREHALTACGQLIGCDFVGLTNVGWTDRNEAEQEAKCRLGRLYVVPHRRWANGFSCLAFVVVGIPVAMRLKTSNYATTFGVCFLPILLVYYPLFMFGLDGAKNGILPPYAAWLGDIVCMSVGAGLLHRELNR
jgi:lipopolysaccharide export system permease protein